jgi:hypothetical protein
VLTSFVVSGPVNGHRAFISVVSGLWALWSALAGSGYTSIFEFLPNSWSANSVENIDNNIIVAIV